MDMIRLKLLIEFFEKERDWTEAAYNVKKKPKSLTFLCVCVRVCVRVCLWSVTEVILVGLEVNRILF